MAGPQGISRTGNYPLEAEASLTQPFVGAVRLHIQSHPDVLGHSDNFGPMESKGKLSHCSPPEDTGIYVVLAGWWGRAFSAWPLAGCRDPWPERIFITHGSGIFNHFFQMVHLLKDII